MANFEELKGKTLTSIDRDGNDKLTFNCDDGSTYYMYHEQDCCESVEIADIVGDLDDLIGTPLLEAEEAEGETGDIDSYDSFTWTFYKLGTIKGHVNIRWYGTSNGYYYEGVSFYGPGDYRYRCN